MAVSLFRGLLILSSLCLTVAVFLANKEQAFLNSLLPSFANLPSLLSYIIYFMLALGFSALSVYLARFLGSDTISKNSLTSIEPANDGYLPSYLGYFFVALSVQNYQQFIFIFGIIYIFVFFSRTGYFISTLFCLGIPVLLRCRSTQL